MKRSEWLLLLLLVLSVFINYVDRGNLSLAAPLLQKELHLSPLQIGSLLAAFFWTYALMQLCGIAGWLTDRFPVGIVFSAGFLLWSLATVATGFLSGFVALYLIRLLLGAGESIAYPCYSRIFATNFPEHHRGRANALLDAGTKLGPAVGTFVGGLLLVRLGWRALFFALGTGCLVWLIPWWRLMPRESGRRRERAERLPSVAQLLGYRSAWGTFLGHFCGNYFFYFLLTWIPVYLVQERGLSIQQMSRLTSAVFLVVAATTIAAGWVADRLISRGVSPTVVRKSVACGGLTLACVIAGVAAIPALRPAIVLLLIACIGYGAYASTHWAISQTLAGPLMAGRWTSIQNGVGNLSGIAGPWLAGFFVETSGSSKWAFVVAGVIALSGAFLWGVMVGRIEPVVWGRITISDTSCHPNG